MFKFEGLKVYQLALDYIDLVYDVASKLPRSEEYNLSSQIKRAATSIALNIAEGSTGQSDPEQARFYRWLFARCLKLSRAGISLNVGST